LEWFSQKIIWFEREPFLKLFFIEKNCAHMKTYREDHFLLKGFGLKNREKRITEIKNHRFEIPDILVY
jgi:hypothetical protein